MKCYRDLADDKDISLNAPTPSFAAMKKTEAEMKPYLLAPPYN